MKASWELKHKGIKYLLVLSLTQQTNQLTFKTIMLQIGVDIVHKV